MKRKIDILVLEDEPSVARAVVMVCDVEGMSVIAVGYIPKPFAADELLTVIRRSLRSSMLREKVYAAKLGRNTTMSFVPSPSGYHRFGNVSWVRMEDEGTARIQGQRTTGG